MILHDPASNGAGASHRLGGYQGMDIDKAAWITAERALARVPLVRRRKVLKLLVRKGRPKSTPEIVNGKRVTQRCILGSSYHTKRTRYGHHEASQRDNDRSQEKT